MAEVMQLMNSEEGKEMGQKMMAEVQSVLSDPDKMRQGLEQFATNPMLKGMAESIPGLQQVLDDPDLMQKSIEEAQGAIAQMGGLEGMQVRMAVADSPPDHMGAPIRGQVRPSPHDLMTL